MQQPKNALINPEVGEALRGKVMIQQSTTSVQDVKETLEWADQYDIKVLKDGVLANPATFFREPATSSTADPVRFMTN